MKPTILGTLSCQLALAGTIAFLPVAASSEESARRIEEVIVTAEKREATVSDTSISITAFGEQQIEDFGMQGPDEMINFIPATTRDAYDIRIRGVGRNFRALGGDPGVATYYNGVYSEDFGIAATEGALYDIERIEVLRGPQGTLYGRNSIGGALNYITNRPSYEPEIKVRGVFGNLATQEYYGVVSGPLIQDKLAFRVTGVRRDRDGSQKGIDGSEDVNTYADQNVAVALNWRITDNMEFNVRWNDRRSDRIIGTSTLNTEGPVTSSGDQTRGVRSVDVYALGIVPVPDPIFGGFVGYTGSTMTFTDPNDSSDVRTGIYARPGVDSSSLSRPNSAYGTNPDVFDEDIKDLHGWALTNDRNDEEFIHNAVQADWTWDINETTQVKWLGGWMDFDYTFLVDSDQSTSTLTDYYALVKESVETYSNELQLLWQIGDNLQMTSGLYHFHANRRQQFSVNDDANQGRYTDAVSYGFMEAFVSVPGTCPPAGAGCVLLPHTRLGDAAPGTSIYGAYMGDVSGCEQRELGCGALYGIDNAVETDAYAIYTQGTYTFNENWALTLGLRWARDDKKAQEQRGGYIEAGIGDPTSGFGAFFVPAAEGFCQAPVPFGLGAANCAAYGLTYLSVMNMFMGNASFVPTVAVDAPNAVNNPIIPTCALDDPDCATPLRLQGLPISWADAGLPSKNSWEKVSWRANL
ncbi:MAG: TonB-dependent receptor, partial [Gammaproteobacteria bacterium]